MTYCENEIITFTPGTLVITTKDTWLAISSDKCLWVATDKEGSKQYHLSPNQFGKAYKDRNWRVVVIKSE